MSSKTLMRVAMILWAVLVSLAAMTLTVGAEGPTLSPCDASYTVTSTNDSGTGSLRQAFSWTCAGGVIDFALTYPATITLTSGELTRLSDVTLVGPGPEMLTISGNDSSRVICTTAPITITGVTIRDGYALGDGGGIMGGNRLVLSNTHVISCTSEQEGGGVFADSWLAVENCRFEHNQAAIGGAISGYDHSLLGADLDRSPDSYYLGGHVVSNSVFISNSAWVACGAIQLPDVLITGSQFLSNTAITLDVGAVYAAYAAMVEDSLFQGNEAAVHGGGLYVDGTLVLSNTTFVDNIAHAGDAGGMLLAGLYDQGPDPVSLGSASDTQRWKPRARVPQQVPRLERVSLSPLAPPTIVRPISLGLSLVISATFDGNSALGIGGGLCSDPGVALALVDSVLRDNVAVEAGGGAAIASNSYITGTQFLRNASTDEYSVGGGLLLGSAMLIVADSGGLNFTPPYRPSSIANCLFRENETQDFGGGLFVDGLLAPYVINASGIKEDALIVLYAPTHISGTTFISNTSAYAGAGLTSDYADILIENSSVTGNVTEGALYDHVLWGTGGGIQLMDVAHATLTNVTIANNRALGDGDDGGGGIMLYGLETYTSELHLNHVTVVGNETTSTGDRGVGGGGVAQFGNCQVVMTNTMVAGNNSAAGVPDIDGHVLSGGGNLIGSTEGCTCTLDAGDVYGDMVDPVDPLTGQLGSYGGSTETVPLLPGSVAINGGTVLGGVAFDQRGIERDGLPDIGAFESRGFSLVAASGTPQRTAVLSQFDEPLVAGVSSAFGEPVDGGRVAISAPQLGQSATLDPDETLTIVGGLASTSATANGNVGSYVVTALIPTGTPTLAKPKGIQFELTNLPVTGEGQFGVGPKALCPGHNLYYSMVVTNTSAEAIMHGLRVTATLPAHAQFYGDMAPADGVYNAANGEIVWDAPALDAGHAATFSWTAHVLSSAPDGALLVGEAAWSSQVLAGATLTEVATVDVSLCAPPEPEALTVFGFVYAGDPAVPAPSRNDLSAQYQGIPGAVVTATTCVAGDWVAITDGTGAYAITIPGEVADQCPDLTLDVFAAGYGEDTGTWTVSDLRRDGERDFVLDPWVYSMVPLILK